MIQGSFKAVKMKFPWCFKESYKDVNKNARRPKEAHIARHLKEIDIVDRTQVDFKE